MCIFSLIGQADTQAGGPGARTTGAQWLLARPRAGRQRSRVAAVCGRARALLAAPLSLGGVARRPAPALLARLALCQRRAPAAAGAVPPCAGRPVPAVALAGGFISGRRALIRVCGRVLVLGGRHVFVGVGRGGVRRGRRGRLLLRRRRQGLRVACGAPHARLDTPGYPAAASQSACLHQSSATLPYGSKPMTRLQEAASAAAPGRCIQASRPGQRRPVLLGARQTPAPQPRSCYPRRVAHLGPAHPGPCAGPRPQTRTRRPRAARPRHRLRRRPRPRPGPPQRPPPPLPPRARPGRPRPPAARASAPWRRLHTSARCQQRAPHPLPRRSAAALMHVGTVGSMPPADACGAAFHRGPWRHPVMPQVIYSRTLSTMPCHTPVNSH